MKEKVNNMRKNTLNELKRGEKAIIKDLQIEGSMKRRLLDIGLIKDSIVECALESPLKDPKAYWIRGALIAIRNNDAKKIRIEGV